MDTERLEPAHEAPTARASRPIPQRTQSAQLQQAEQDALSIARNALDPASHGPLQPMQSTLTPAESVAVPETAVAGSGGEPLPQNLREPPLSRIGVDLGRIRIHSDQQAAQRAQALDAKAFTLGEHIGFNAGQYRPETPRGLALLAHEIAHVAQQQHGAPVLQRAPLDSPDPAAEPTAEAIPGLDEILPRHVGPLADMFRVIELHDVFGADLLRAHVQRIRTNREARAIVLEYGVPGIVALYDTSRNDEIDPGLARRALKATPQRYASGALRNLHLRLRREADPTYWFEDPASQKTPESREGDLPITGREARKKVFVEPKVSYARAGKNTVFVRFAYPEPDVGTAKVTKAKDVILLAIANAVANLTGRPLGSLPAPTTREERLQQEQLAARLDAVWRAFAGRMPLNVYIATDPRVEFETQQVAATTQRVYVSLADVGDPAKLAVAIRVPLIMLEGGILPTRGGIQEVPKVTPEALRGLLLHEAVHALLAQRASDANAIWETHGKQLTIDANLSVKARFVEMVRKFLIAQEEVFSYENEATLYPPLSPMKARYDLYIKTARSFLERRGLKFAAVAKSIPVSKKVAGKDVHWEISYQVPNGAVALSVEDMPVLDLILSVYALN